MRLLVTGAGGMLGRDVAAAGEAAGHDVVALTRGDLDIVDGAAVGAALERSRPDAVINCAAWTDVDGAEADEPGATAVNGTGAANVAHAAAATGTHVVQVSTDYVFAGDADGPYVEEAPTGPRTAYGRSKLAGDTAVLAASGTNTIARTAWLFGVGGRNFVATMLSLGAERDHVDVVADQTGCPTWTGHLAPALVTLAERRSPGIHHVAAAGACTWRDLAAAAFELAGVDCEARPTTTDRFPRPAPRPAMSALAVTRADTPRLPAWREGVCGYLAEAGYRGG